MKLCGLLAEAPSQLGERMHNSAFRHLGLDFCYVAFKTTDTASGLQAMRDLGFRGLSLSIPHKEAALQYVDVADAHVKAIGATNTVINEQGKLSAFNTDWQGIIGAFREAGVDVSGKKVLIFGAGGAARAAVYALKQEKAGEIVIVNRSDERAENIARDFGIKSCPLEKFAEVSLNDRVLFINTTPMADEDFSFVLAGLPATAAVFDMVTMETALMKAARARGLKVIEGTRMLLFQALEQFRLFTGYEAPREVMENALSEALQAVG